MACSLGAMSAAAMVGCPSGLGFKDSSLLARPTSTTGGKLSSFVLPSLRVSRTPLVNKAKRVLASAGPHIGTKLQQQQRPLAFNPLEDSPVASSFGLGLPQQVVRKRRAAPVKALEGDAGEVVKVEEKEGLLSKKSLTTGSFFFAWYFLNVIFNILNKKIYNYFPYPYFVSVIHLLVGVIYCIVCWGLGLPKRAPIDKELLLLLTPVAFCHALGHVMTNVSFAAVAVSFTHTIKSLEPFFNAAASQFILGQQIPITLWLSLAPIVLGVSAASMTELSFNWRGFISAMTANVAFTYRNIYSKKAMTGMDSTNVYAYISILSLLFCIPPAIIVEGPALLKYGFSDAVAKVGMQKFVSDLFWVGMFYHLYNQLANNTLERVAPLTHAVGNVLKRVFVIGFSIIVFGNKISTQTGIGTVIAIAGVAVYSIIKADIEEKRRAATKLSEPPPS
ncbi:unnamed protein product [Calypogeia fissa]